MDAKEKINDFEIRMIKAGYQMNLISKKINLYSINDKLVHVRSASSHSKYKDDRVYFYSINLNSLNSSDYVIYLMTTGNYFIMFPKYQLLGYIDEMYQNNKDFGTKVFNINWDSLKLWLKNSFPVLLDVDYDIEGGVKPIFN